MSCLSHAVVAPFALLALVLLAGCGDDASTQDAQPWQRLVLRAESTADGPRAVARAEPIAVGVDAPDWTLQGGSWDDAGRLRPSPAGALLVRRAPIALDGLHALRVTATSLGRGQFGVALLRKGLPLVELGPFPLATGGTPQPLTITLPARLAAHEVADALRLVLAADESITLAKLERITYPAGAVLPDPDRPPELLCLGEQARLAVGLLSERPLSSVLPGSQAGVLRLATGRPEPLRVPDAPCVLRVLDDAGRLLGEHAFADPRDRDDDWVDLAFDVPAGTGRRVHFVLAADPGAGCALAEVAFLPRPSDSREPAARGADPSAHATPRTVLLVTSDTHRGDHLGVAGEGVPVATPNLDALARRGTLFTDCFSSANFTNPSHAALMTGTTPRETGIVSNDRALDAAAPTLAERFRDAGFRTWGVLSAHHLGDAVSGLGQGFDRLAWPDASQRPADPTLDIVERWLDADDPRPLFLWVHLFDAHLPYVPLPEFDRRGYDGPEDPFDPALPPLAIDALLPAGLHGLRDVEFVRAQYRACVTSLDHELPRLFGHPLLRDAITAVVGDHGESLGAHDIWFNHGGLYPDTLHVPLVLAGPGVDVGAVQTRPVRQVDLGRTLLDLAGLADAPFPGRSLLTHADDDDGARFALASHATSASITLGASHLVLQLVDHHQRWRAHDVELYDLAVDPGSTTDLAPARPEQTRALRARLIAWLTADDGARWAGSVDDDAQLREQLAALGYVGADASHGGPLFVEDDCESCRRYR